MSVGIAASKKLRERVGAQASALLVDRLCTSLEQCADSTQLVRALDKVRTSLRLFVDEKLADAVDADLRAVARASIR